MSAGEFGFGAAPAGGTSSFFNPKKEETGNGKEKEDKGTPASSGGAFEPNPFGGGGGSTDMKPFPNAGATVAFGAPSGASSAFPQAPSGTTGNKKVPVADEKTKEVPPPTESKSSGWGPNIMKPAGVGASSFGNASVGGMAPSQFTIPPKPSGSTHEKTVSKEPTASSGLTIGSTSPSPKNPVTNTTTPAAPATNMVPPAAGITRRHHTLKKEKKSVSLEEEKTTAKAGMVELSDDDDDEADDEEEEEEDADSYTASPEDLEEVIEGLAQQLEENDQLLAAANEQLARQPKLIPFRKVPSSFPNTYTPVLDTLPAMASNLQELKSLCQDAMKLRYDTELQSQTPATLKAKLRSYRETHITPTMNVRSGSQGHRWQDLLRKAQDPDSTPADCAIAVDSMWHHLSDVQQQASQRAAKPSHRTPTFMVGYRPRQRVPKSLPLIEPSSPLKLIGAPKQITAAAEDKTPGAPKQILGVEKGKEKESKKPGDVEDKKTFSILGGTQQPFGAALPATKTTTETVGTLSSKGKTSPSTAPLVPPAAAGAATKKPLTGKKAEEKDPLFGMLGDKTGGTGVKPEAAAGEKKIGLSGGFTGFTAGGGDADHKASKFSSHPAKKDDTTTTTTTQGSTSAASADITGMFSKKDDQKGEGESKTEGTTAGEKPPGGGGFPMGAFGGKGSEGAKGAFGAAAGGPFGTSLDSNKTAAAPAPSSGMFGGDSKVQAPPGGPASTTAANFTNKEAREEGSAVAGAGAQSKTPLAAGGGADAKKEEWSTPSKQPSGFEASLSPGATGTTTPPPADAKKESSAPAPQSGFGLSGGSPPPTVESKKEATIPLEPKPKPDTTATPTQGFADFTPEKKDAPVAKKDEGIVSTPPPAPSQQTTADSSGFTVGSTPPPSGTGASAVSGGADMFAKKDAPAPSPFGTPSQTIGSAAWTSTPPPPAAEAKKEATPLVPSSEAKPALDFTAPTQPSLSGLSGLSVTPSKEKEGPLSSSVSAPLTDSSKPPSSLTSGFPAGAPPVAAAADAKGKTPTLGGSGSGAFDAKNTAPPVTAAASGEVKQAPFGGTPVKSTFGGAQTTQPGFNSKFGGATAAPSSNTSGSPPPAPDAAVEVKKEVPAFVQTKLAASGGCPPTKPFPSNTQTTGTSNFPPAAQKHFDAKSGPGVMAGGPAASSTSTPSTPAGTFGTSEASATTTSSAPPPAATTANGLGSQPAQIESTSITGGSGPASEQPTTANPAQPSGFGATQTKMTAPATNIGAKSGMFPGGASSSLPGAANSAANFNKPPAAAVLAAPTTGFPAASQFQSQPSAGAPGGFGSQQQNAAAPPGFGAAQQQKQPVGFGQKQPMQPPAGAPPGFPPSSTGSTPTTPLPAAGGFGAQQTGPSAFASGAASSGFAGQAPAGGNAFAAATTATSWGNNPPGQQGGTSLGSNVAGHASGGFPASAGSFKSRF